MWGSRVAVVASLATVACALAWSAPQARAAPEWLLPPSILVGPDAVGETCSPPFCPPFPPFYSGYPADPHVYMDAAGDALALFSPKSGGLVAETRPAGGTFGPPQTLDPSLFVGQVPEFQAAFDGQGNACVVWTSHGTGNLVVDEASAPPGGAFSAPRLISGGSETASEPRLAVSPRGDVLVTWIEAGGVHPDTVADASIQDAGTAFFTAPVTLSPPAAGGVADLFPPVPALDSNGDAVVVWTQETSHGTGDYRVQAALRPAGGSFGAPQEISQSSSNSQTVAMDPQGDALAVWLDSGGFESSFRPAGGTFQPTPTPVPSGGTQPQLAMDAAGEAIAVWMHGTSPSWIEASIRPPGGTFQAVPTVLSSTTGVVTAGPALAVNSLGDAFAVWVDGDDPDPPSGISSDTPHHVRVAERAPGGSFGAPTSLLDAPPNTHEGDPSVPSIAIDGSGDALAAFENIGAGADATHGAETIQVAPYDAAGPQLRSVSVPAQLVARQAGSFAVSAVDVFSGVSSTSWDFGDGSGAQQAAASHAYAKPGTYTVTVRSSDGIGNSSSATRTVTVTAAPLPRISGLRISPSSFVAAKRRHGRHSKRRGGARVTYVDSQAAVTRFKVERLVSGRRAGHRCVKPTKRNRRHRHCTRRLVVEKFTHHDKAGKNTVRLTGVVHRRSLPPGSYLLVAVPRDVNGTGGAVSRRFRIKRR